MGSEWGVSQFKELYLIPSRNGLTKPKRVRGEGVKFINMGEIFSFDRMKNIPTDRVPVTKSELKTSKLEKNDLLFARQSLVLSGAGKCSIFLDDEEPVVFESHLIRVRADTTKIYPDYLYYFFISPQGRAEIWAITEQGAGQAGIRGSDLETIKIPIPPLVEQKAIAYIFGSLDDKIELNRQMNATLEAMAQTLFKSWFVDFDPVIDNALAAGNAIPEEFAERAEQRLAAQGSANGGAMPLGGDQAENGLQSQFPSEFEWTAEKGWIPKGWVSEKLSSMAKHIKVSVKAEEISDDDMYVGLEHIGRKEIFLSNSECGDKVTSNKSRFKKSDILFGKLRPYFHKVCIAPEKGICSTDILVFRPIKKNLYSFVAMMLFSNELVEYANLRSTGTRMPRASAKDILAYEVLDFPCEIADAFESTLSSIWAKGLSANRENQNLTSLRDTLLPKLLSGEVRIADAEKMVEEAGL